MPSPSQGELRPTGGLILVDKPPGPTSASVVRSLGRALGVKAGHAGTLDPLATGLLLVLVGPATRLARYLVGLDKRYVTTIQLGRTTTTGDAEGAPLADTPVPDIEQAVASLPGLLDLPVPAASAVKIDGERAYERHRRGEDFERPVRRSVIRDARLLDVEGTSVTLELSVSSGTYVRSIAEHLGGHCTALRRTAVGPFNVEAADDSRVRPALDALPFLPLVALGDQDTRHVMHGREVQVDCPDGLCRLVSAGALVAVGRVEAGVARPETVLAAA